MVTMDSRRLIYWEKALKQQHQQTGRLNGPGSSSGTCSLGSDGLPYVFTASS